jgi:hypothetical protein
VNLKDLTVLELGCYEGHHSVSLAQHAKHVTAIDGRIENVLKTMIKIWATKMETRATSNLINLERENLKGQLKLAGLATGYDLIHHRGVLYHLSDPITNIMECAAVCRKYLYLHTQISKNDAATNVAERGKFRYHYFKYKEPRVAFAPFAGICDYAMWLSKQSLMDLLKNAGFSKIRVLSEVEERN